MYTFNALCNFLNVKKIAHLAIEFFSHLTLPFQSLHSYKLIYALDQGSV